MLDPRMAICRADTGPRHAVLGVLPSSAGSQRLVAYPQAGRDGAEVGALRLVAEEISRDDESDCGQPGAGFAKPRRRQPKF